MRFPCAPTMQTKSPCRFFVNAGGLRVLPVFPGRLLKESHTSSRCQIGRLLLCRGSTHAFGWRRTVGMSLWGVASGALPLSVSVWIPRGTADLPEAGSAMFVCITQVAIAVGSAVGGAIVDRAGIHADFTLGLGLAGLGLIALQRLAAMERPAPAPFDEAGCDASPDFKGGADRKQ